MVSGGTRAGTDIVYLSDTLAAKYYSRFADTQVQLGISNNIMKQVCGFLAYNRIRFQELQYGTAKKIMGGKPKNKPGTTKGKPFYKTGVISIGRDDVSSDSEQQQQINPFADANAAWDKWNE